MLTGEPCKHDEETRKKCGGYYTTTDMKMAEMRPEHDVHFYHDIMHLFEEAFYLAYEKGDHGDTVASSTD